MHAFIHTGGSPSHLISRLPIVKALMNLNGLTGFGITAQELENGHYHQLKAGTVLFVIFTSLFLASVHARCSTNLQQICYRNPPMRNDCKVYVNHLNHTKPWFTSHIRDTVCNLHRYVLRFLCKLNAVSRTTASSARNGVYLLIKDTCLRTNNELTATARETFLTPSASLTFSC